MKLDERRLNFEVVGALGARVDLHIARCWSGLLLRWLHFHTYIIPLYSTRTLGGGLVLKLQFPIESKKGRDRRAFPSAALIPRKT